MHHNSLPLYNDYNLLKNELALKCPLLTLITTSLEFYELLRTKSGGASKIKIRMQNLEGNIVSANARSFLSGNTTNKTTIERQNVNQLLSEKNKGVFVREKAYMQYLVSILALRGINIAVLIHEAETAAPDGYVSSDTEQSFVGIQATRSTAGEAGICRIHKSQEYLFKQACTLGFMVFVLLFLEDECCGILFLSPEDEALISSLPAFKSFHIVLGKGGIRSAGIRKNSVYAKLSKNLILWDNRDDANKSRMQNEFLDRVSLFLSKANILKHTLQEFYSMMPHGALVELQYIARLKEIFPRTERIHDRQFGDVQIPLGNVNVVVELKLATLECRLYNAVVFRSHHSLVDCVNLASVVAFAVLNSKNTPKAERASDPSVYKYVFHITLTVHM
jgi:hypothetical protein